MKIVRPLFYSAVAGCMFASCKTSITTIPVPNGTNISINIPAKKGSLTEEEMQRWSHADLRKRFDSWNEYCQSLSVFRRKKRKPIIVAIADSGVDVEHEDLKNVAWVNPKEIAGNNIDDDKNGYVDDIYGWNFLGNENGDIVVADQLEITRIVKKGRDTFGDQKASEIAEEDRIEYENFLKIQEEFNRVSEAKKTEIANLEKTAERILQIEENFKAVKKLVGKEDYTEEDLKA